MILHRLAKIAPMKKPRTETGYLSIASECLKQTNPAKSYILFYLQ